VLDLEDEGGSSDVFDPTEPGAFDDVFWCGIEAGAGSSEAAGRGPRIEGEREAAEVVYYLKNGGKFAYYRKSKTVYCTCPNPLHGKCILSRTCASEDAKEAGRPLGICTYFLNTAFSLPAGQNTKTAHFKLVRDCTRAQRVVSREILKKQPGSQALLDCERRIKANEPEEPE